MHERWLAKQTFNHPAQQIVFQDHVDVINAARVRLAALEQQLREIVPTWTMAPVVAAYQALRGVSLGHFPTTSEHLGAWCMLNNEPPKRGLPKPPGRNGSKGAVGRLY
jgi:hypothetical protein